MEEIIIEPLELPSAHCVYDAKEQLCKINYKGILTPQITKQAYSWMAKNLQNNAERLHLVRGCIFDFREVVIFDRGNLAAARNQSKAFQKQFVAPISSIPIAVVIQSMYQEMMVKTVMKASGRLGADNAITLVKSINAAHQFIEQWHQSTNRPATQQ